MIVIREEIKGDRADIFTVHNKAFAGDGEARLVDALRTAHASELSLVAEFDGNLCGHILFSAVTLEVNSLNKKVLGLAPLAVLPSNQNQGVGALLTRSALERCANLGYDAVVVLGSSAYYPRCGFGPAADFGLISEYPVAPEHFMAFELQPHGLEGCGGLTRYHHLVNELDI